MSLERKASWLDPSKTKKLNYSREKCKTPSDFLIPGGYYL
ncbi:hypothetical protein TcasGA2_TC013274 [Tribolium castaneum]|uniref:Uncharacterized protein n=1 Tax=Tribolium castaneum TaxID=7070 RepID=D6WUF2_TRICA|nr:hypothetical protein TcasGA2_TC013274 [Tribolium castaneum]